MVAPRQDRLGDLAVRWGGLCEQCSVFGGGGLHAVAAARYISMYHAYSNEQRVMGHDAAWQQSMYTSTYYVPRYIHSGRTVRGGGHAETSA